MPVKSLLLTGVLLVRSPFFGMVVPAKVTHSAFMHFVRTGQWKDPSIRAVTRDELINCGPRSDVFFLTRDARRNAFYSANELTGWRKVEISSVPPCAEFTPGLELTFSNTEWEARAKLLHTVGHVYMVFSGELNWLSGMLQVASLKFEPFAELLNAIEQPLGSVATSLSNKADSDSYVDFLKQSISQLACDDPQQEVGHRFCHRSHALEWFGVQEIPSGGKNKGALMRCGDEDSNGISIPEQEGSRNCPTKFFARSPLSRRTVQRWRDSKLKAWHIGTDMELAELGGPLSWPSRRVFLLDCRCQAVFTARKN